MLNLNNKWQYITFVFLIKEINKVSCKYIFLKNSFSISYVYAIIIVHFFFYVNLNLLLFWIQKYIEINFTEALYFIMVYNKKLFRTKANYFHYYTFIKVIW